MDKARVSLFLATVIAAVWAAPAAAQTTENYSAMNVCKFTQNQPDGHTFHSSASILNLADSARDVICPLKQVVCTTSGCTYSANVYVSDGNNADATDSNVICKLGFQRKNEASENYGTAVTHSSPNYTLTYKTISVSVPAADSYLIFVRCSLGKKDPEDLNLSYMTWIEATYP